MLLDNGSARAYYAHITTHWAYIMSTFKIAGKDFFQYVAYRLKKDGLGFLPASKWENGATDTKTHIRAIVPKNAYDFLVYCHELGHCKSKQLQRSMGSSFFGWDVCDNTLHNEYNAWVWAFRYMDKLKMRVSKSDLVKALNASFKSYTSKADNKRLANDLIEKLNDLLGIELEMESVRPVYNVGHGRFWNSKPLLDTSWVEDSWEPVKGWFDEMHAWGEAIPAKPTKNEKHRPWMDLLDKQRKKGWKHKR